MTSASTGKKPSNIVAYLFSLSLLSLSFPIHSANVQLNDQTQHYIVGPNLEYLIDSQSNLSIEEITSSAKTSFIKNKMKTLSLGYTDSTIWVKLSIDTNALSNTFSVKKWIAEVNFPPIDEITFYQMDANHEYIPLITGDLYPSNKRDIKTTSYAFDLNLSPNQLNTVYFRIKSESSMRIPIHIYTQSAFIQQLDFRKTQYGLFGGIMIAMLIYNLLLFLTSRDQSYLYYVLYVSSFILYQINLNGLGHQYFWHVSPWWSHHSLAFSIACVGIFGPLFTQSFLHTKTHTPLIHKLLGFNAAIATGLAGWSLVAGSYSQIVIPLLFLTLSTFIMIFISGVANLLRNNRLARYFLIASIALIIGGITEAMAAIAWLPSNTITSSASLYGFIAFSLLLSFALADRINVYRNGKTKAENDAKENLILANKNLAHNNKIKNDFLATVSRELNPPMDGIVQHLNAIRNIDTSKEIQNHIHSASVYAADMSLMIEELLGISEVQSSSRLDAVLDWEQLDIDQLKLDSLDLDSLELTPFNTEDYKLEPSYTDFEEVGALITNPLTAKPIDKNQATSNPRNNAPLATTDNSDLASHRTLDILIVEDNPVHLMLLKSILLSLNYRVHTASNGQEALNYVYVEHADCILMDLHMPDMSGLEITTAIRHLNQYQHTPIIAVTAKSASEYQQDCFDLGMNDFISKPVNIKLIQETLDTWLIHGGKKKAIPLDPPPNYSPPSSQ
ncbi:MAG: response regulator [Pseudomonadales bacterium]|nr:response regulator [Pseudomonadales bacterium]